MNESGRTQIARGSKISKPTRLILEDADLTDRSVLHHGAGKAQADTDAMYDSGASFVAEYDPNSPIVTWRNPAMLSRDYDVVVSNYVLNVLTPSIRSDVLCDIWRSTNENGIAYISVRSEGDKSIHGEPEFDGVRTSRGTFQKGFTKEEFIAELSPWFQQVSIVHDAGGTLLARCARP